MNTCVCVCVWERERQRELPQRGKVLLSLELLSRYKSVWQCTRADQSAYTACRLHKPDGVPMLLARSLHRPEGLSARFATLLRKVGSTTRDRFRNAFAHTAECFILGITFKKPKGLVLWFATFFCFLTNYIYLNQF